MSNPLSQDKAASNAPLANDDKIAPQAAVAGEAKIAHAKPVGGAGVSAAPGRTLIKVGVNYPWKNYGWDFGNPPSGYTKVNFKTDVPNDLDHFKKLGAFAVRWFILGDGFTYGTGSHAPRPDTDPSRTGQWRFHDPPELQNYANGGDYSQIKKDFEDLLKLLKERQMQIIPSLIDHKWCLAGKTTSNAGFVKQGRSDVVNDGSKRKKFFDRVLEPLLDISKKYRETIYAWELINEPEGAVYGRWETHVFSLDIKYRSDLVAGKINSRLKSAFDNACFNLYEVSAAAALAKIDGNNWRLTDGVKSYRIEIGSQLKVFKRTDKTVTVGTMKTFIKQGVGRINAAGFKSTVGMANFETFNNSKWDYPKLGITLHQAHYYPKYKNKFKCCCGIQPRGGRLRTHWFSSKYPCFIGEFSTTPNEYHRPKDKICVFHWPDLKSDQGVYARLKLIESKKYPAAFVWSRHAGDKATDWSQSTQDSIQKYTSGR
jgi:hypothetical protein